MPTPSVARPRLEDVARLAEVSLGSASRALSNPGQVKPKTLERVQKAVAQLGYVRNGAASALAHMISQGREHRHHTGEADDAAGGHAQ